MQSVHGIPCLQTLIPDIASTKTLEEFKCCLHNFAEKFTELDAKHYFRLRKSLTCKVFRLGDNSEEVLFYAFP